MGMHTTHEALNSLPNGAFHSRRVAIDTEQFTPDRNLTTTILIQRELHQVSTIRALRARIGNHGPRVFANRPESPQSIDVLYHAYSRELLDVDRHGLGTTTGRADALPAIVSVWDYRRSSKSRSSSGMPLP